MFLGVRNHSKAHCFQGKMHPPCCTALHSKHNLNETISNLDLHPLHPLQHWETGSLGMMFQKGIDETKSRWESARRKGTRGQREQNTIRGEQQQNTPESLQQNARTQQMHATTHQNHVNYEKNNMAARAERMLHAYTHVHALIFT